MPRLLLTFILLPLHTMISAQFNEIIRTGRPGQAIGAFTVGTRIFQVQSGFDYYGSNEKNGTQTIKGFSNNTVLRYGLTEPFEISALLDYRTQTLSENSVKEKTSGLSALDLGMRYHIYTGKGLIPNIGFQFRLRLPVLSEDYKIDHIAPRFIIVTSQQLSKTFTLITNWGATWNGNNSSPAGTYVINLAFPFTEKLGAFVETFGVYGGGDFFINFDTGLAWLLTPDLQLDIYGGYGSNYGINDYFMSTGISWRTKKRQ